MGTTLETYQRRTTDAAVTQISGALRLRGSELSQIPGVSGLNRSTYLDQNLTGPENIMMPDIPLQNRTELRLLVSVANTISHAILPVDFQDGIDSPYVVHSDSEIATRLRPHAQVLNSVLYNDKRQVRPILPGDFTPYVATGSNAQEILEMALLVALQPEIPIPENANIIPIIGRNDLGRANYINDTILQARLLSEIILERFQMPDQAGRRSPLPDTELTERYLAQRSQFRDSVRPYMRTFQHDLTIEYEQALDIMSPQQRFGAKGSKNDNLHDALAYFDAYKTNHAGLPWHDIVGEYRREEAKSPSEIIARLRGDRVKYSPAYEEVLVGFADQLEVEFAKLQEDPDSEISLDLPAGGGPDREGYAETISLHIISNGDQAIRTLCADLHTGEESQTTHPISGTSLFVVITGYKRKEHEYYSDSYPPRHVGGLKFKRKIVSSNFLAPSVRSAFNFKASKLAA